MRLYAPLYEGDSILRPDAALGEPAVRVFRSPAPAPDFVRSNIQAEAANETALDIHAIEQIARNHRNAEIARLLKPAFAAVGAWFARIGAWFENSDNFMRDSFFAASENLADLEQRQRHYERTGLTHY
jgi:hypothetical protein